MTRSAVSQSPKSMQVLGLDFTVGRETFCGLESKTLNGSEGQGFVLPPNMKKVFGDIDLDSIDFQVSFIFRLCFISFAFHLISCASYFWLPLYSFVLFTLMSVPFYVSFPSLFFQSFLFVRLFH